MKSFASSVVGMTVLFLLTPCRTEAVDLRIKVGELSASSGNTISVPVIAAEGPIVEAGRVTLAYDPDILELSGVEPGAESEAGNALAGFTLNEPGRVTMNFVSTEGVAGEGEWFVAIFKVKGEKGTACPLTVEKVVAFRFDNRVDILSDVTHGRFSVVSALPWPLPASLGGGLLLMGIVVMGRRHQGRTPGTKATAASAATCSCPKCGCENGTTSRFCSDCGQPLNSSATDRCKGCREPLSPGEKFCTQCGTTTS